LLVVEPLVNLLSDETKRDEHKDIPGNDSASICLESSVEGGWSFLESLSYTVQNSSILPHFSVHQSSFKDIDWTTYDTSRKAGNSRRYQMAGHTVLHEVSFQDHGFYLVECCDLGCIDYRVPDHIRADTCPEAFYPFINKLDTLIISLFCCRPG
jgi:hypothetical protein